MESVFVAAATASVVGAEAAGTARRDFARPRNVRRQSRWRARQRPGTPRGTIALGAHSVMARNLDRFMTPLTRALGLRHPAY